MLKTTARVIHARAHSVLNGVKLDIVPNFLLPSPSLGSRARVENVTSLFRLCLRATTCCSCFSIFHYQRFNNLNTSFSAGAVSRNVSWTGKHQPDLHPTPHCKQQVQHPTYYHIVLGSETAGRRKKGTDHYGMVLTQPKTTRQPRDPNKFPTAQLALLGQ